MTKGWCPVDDRVFSSSDGRCPECGRTLVALGGRGEGSGSSPRIVVEHDAADAIEPATAIPASETRASEPIGIAPPLLAAAVTAIAVLAFLLGIAFPRGRGSSRTAEAPAARSAYTVHVERRGPAGVSFTLETFTQRGRRLILRMTVPQDSPLPIGGISRVEIVASAAGGRELGRFAMPARATTTGFILDGAVLQRADVPVTGIEIVAVSSAADANANFLVDLSRVWPASSGPRAGRLVERQTTEDGRTISLRGVVGWPDRLEIGFETTGAREGWFFEDRWTLTIENRRPIEGNTATETFRGTTRSGSLVFLDVPASAREVLIGYSAGAVTVNGSWRWNFDG